MPAVSIIVPAFRAAATIAETIASVRAQTFGAWELIVSDDGSPDDTVEVATRSAEGDSRIRIFRNPPSGSPSIIRNRAMGHAEGDWIAFLDADDVWHPEKLQRQFAALKKSQKRWGFANVRIEGGGDEHPPGAYYPAGWRPEVPFFPQLLTGDGIPLITLIATRELLVEAAEGRGIAAAFDENLKHRAARDWELTLRLAARAEPAYVPQPLATYRIVHGSFSRDGEKHFACTTSVIADWRARGIGAEVCDRADRLHLSKRATHRLFHGGGPWRGDMRAGAASPPWNARSLFFAGLSFLPESWARAAYRTALSARRGA